MKQLIPPQHTGAASNTVDTIKTGSDEAARTLFNKARKNLLNVNSWQELSGTMSAAFELTDADGKPLKRVPQQGDLFRIDIPGPGDDDSQGYDWVKIEKIEEELRDPSHNYTAITVRPTPSPNGFQASSNHFFTAEATSTFCVERRDKQVLAAVFGRNEKPNTDTPGLFGKIRNAIVGFLAMLGFNKPQWASLVKGILEKDADAITFRK